MNDKPSFWQRIGIQDWFLSEERKPVSGLKTDLSPDDVYRYIVEKFAHSVPELSFGDRVVFYHEFIISFNADDYRLFTDNRKGLFGLITHECVKKFYSILADYAEQGRTVEPSANKWVFRFASHPDYKKGDIGFIGKLLPGAVQKQENLRVTFIPRQTGIAETFDLNESLMKDFIFYSEGYYELPYMEDHMFYNLKSSEGTMRTLARLETILPGREYAGKKVEYLMRDPEIIVSGDEEQKEASFIFKIPSEWVSSPHLRIRYDESSDKFFVASFGDKTLLNEQLLRRSETGRPEWVELPVNSRMLLNGIVGINLFR